MENKIKTSKFCKYCMEEIKYDASVCNHCGQPQNILIHFIGYFGLIPNLISILLLIVAIIQTNLASEEKQSAELANLNVQKALVRISETERKINDTKKDVLIVAESIIKISEILPRATGYGAGLSKSDNLILMKNIDLIKKISKNSEKNK